MQRKIRRFR